MTWAVLAVAAAALFAALAVPILLHAFRRSVGTGVMVLFIPGYVLLYAFRQFEHPRRHLIVPGFLGALVLVGLFVGLAAPGLAPPPPGSLAP